MTLAFRTALPSDARFVCDAWAASMRLARYAGHLDMAHWSAIAVEQAKRYIARPYVATIIAYEDAKWARAADIYGFIAADVVEGQTPYVYYAYVKDEYRKHGYCRALMAAAGTDLAGRFDYLCSTPSTYHMAKAGKIPLAKWNPIPGRFGKDRAA